MRTCTTRRSCYTRQTLGYPAPGFAARAGCGAEAEAGPLPGDVAVPGGVLQLGSPPGTPFVFDNEKWAHPVEVRPSASRVRR